MMLSGIESLAIAWTISEILVELKHSSEHIIPKFRGEPQRLNFLLLLQSDDELIWILKREKIE